jgi:hypothetical protein
LGDGGERSEKGVGVHRSLQPNIGNPSRKCKDLINYNS